MDKADFKSHFPTRPILLTVSFPIHKNKSDMRNSDFTVQSLQRDTFFRAQFNYPKSHSHTFIDNKL